MIKTEKTTIEKRELPPLPALDISSCLLLSIFCFFLNGIVGMPSAAKISVVFSSILFIGLGLAYGAKKLYERLSDHGKKLNLSDTASFNIAYLIFYGIRSFSMGFAVFVSYTKAGVNSPKLGSLCALIVLFVLISRVKALMIKAENTILKERDLGPHPALDVSSVIHLSIFCFFLNGIAGMPNVAKISLVFSSILFIGLGLAYGAKKLYERLSDHGKKLNLSDNASFNIAYLIYSGIVSFSFGFAVFVSYTKADVNIPKLGWICASVVFITLTSITHIVFLFRKTTQ